MITSFTYIALILTMHVKPLTIFQPLPNSSYPDGGCLYYMYSGTSLQWTLWDQPFLGHYTEVFLFQR